MYHHLNSPSDTYDIFPSPRITSLDKHGENIVVVENSVKASHPRAEDIHKKEQGRKMASKSSDILKSPSLLKRIDYTDDSSSNSSENDFFEYSEKQHMKPRWPYSPAEDEEILRFMLSGDNIYKCYSISVWKCLENHKNEPKRTYQSLKNRFLRNIKPVLFTKFRYMLNEKHITKIREKFPELQERKRPLTGSLKTASSNKVPQSCASCYCEDFPSKRNNAGGSEGKVVGVKISRAVAPSSSNPNRFGQESTSGVEARKISSKAESKEGGAEGLKNGEIRDPKADGRVRKVADDADEGKKVANDDGVDCNNRSDRLQSDLPLKVNVRVTVTADDVGGADGRSTEENAAAEERGREEEEVEGGNGAERRRKCKRPQTRVPGARKRIKRSRDLLIFKMKKYRFNTLKSLNARDREMLSVLLKKLQSHELQAAGETGSGAEDRKKEWTPNFQVRSPSRVPHNGDSSSSSTSLNCSDDSAQSEILRRCTRKHRLIIMADSDSDSVAPSKVDKKDAKAENAEFVRESESDDLRRVTRSRDARRALRNI